MFVDQNLHKKAFQAFLRKGTPIEMSIKQARPTTHYISRTRNDVKVRSSHADQEGRVFSWDDPPVGAHPGEDYNCRCTAEPYYPETSEFLRISIDGLDTTSGWSSTDFVNHYFNGNRRSLTLTQIGHSQTIISAFIDRRGEALKGQLASAARSSRSGSVFYNFKNTYDMTDIVFSIGDTTIGGSFSGQSVKQNGIIELSGSLELYLSDEFADPLDVGVDVDDYRPGSILYDNTHQPLNDYLRGRAGPPTGGQQRLGVHEGKPYAITGTWSGSVEGRVYADPSRSQYAR